jgi:hypothetical protein
MTPQGIGLRPLARTTLLADVNVAAGELLRRGGRDLRVLPYVNVLDA